MIATPVIPGFLYRVSGAGRTRVVSARNACHAICRAARLYWAELSGSAGK